MKNTLSVIVLTHNDESRIVDCLECLQFADELIVIDDESTDRTVDLVKQYTSKIFTKKLNNNFANQRNFALNHVHSDWVLFIDSDELVSERLREEIAKKMKDNTIHGYFFKRYDFMWGKKIRHGEVGQVRLLRLGRAGYGKWKGAVHEVWKINGKKAEIDAPLIHVPHQNTGAFIDDIDNYSTLRANELLYNDASSTSLGIIVYPIAKFVQNYVLRMGYKDGIPGFIYAVLMSFHSFLVRAKLYQLRNK